MRAASRHLLAPSVGTGVLIAAYLLFRPYGDADDGAAAAAFASTAWVVAHLFGALGLASVGRLGLRIADASDGLAAKVARWAGLTGTVLVLPYYGAEMFGLHAVGQRGLSDPSVLVLIEEIRNVPVALVTFGLGLILLSVAGVAIALAARSSLRFPAWSAWPLGVLIALFPAQFYVPSAGRIAFGLLYLAAAAVFVLGALRRREQPDPA